MNATALAQWPDVLPLDGLSRLPKFPVDVLPDPFMGFVMRAAQELQVDPGLPGSICLAVLSACCAKKGRVQISGNHIEPLQLYVAVTAGSGERKSPTFSCLTKPVYEYQRELQRESPDDFPTLILDDVTPESLSERMKANDERMAILSPESGIFSLLSGLYGEGKSNIDLILKGHSCEPWSSSRISRGINTMDAPAITMGLTLQPSMLDYIGKNKEFQGRGLLNRYLFCITKSNVGKRFYKQMHLDHTLQKEYELQLKRLLSKGFSDKMLQLEPDAFEAWRQFHDEIEKSIGESGDLHEIQGWGSKLPASVARIAGLLHMAIHPKPHSEKISHLTMAAAITLGAFFAHHAKVTFGVMGQNDDMNKARLVLEYLAKNRPQTFTARDIQKNKSALKSVVDVNQGIKVLEEEDYVIAKQSNAHRGAGRPAGKVYQVNPKVYMNPDITGKIDKTKSNSVGIVGKK